MKYFSTCISKKGSKTEMLNNRIPNRPNNVISPFEERVFVPFTLRELMANTTEEQRQYLAAAIQHRLNEGFIELIRWVNEHYYMQGNSALRITNVVFGGLLSVLDNMLFDVIIYKTKVDYNNLKDPNTIPIKFDNAIGVDIVAAGNDNELLFRTYYSGEMMLRHIRRNRFKEEDYD